MGVLDQFGGAVGSVLGQGKGAGVSALASLGKLLC
jgi:hypothetical protein